MLALALIVVAAGAVLALLLSSQPPSGQGSGPPTGIPGKVIFNGDFAKGLGVWSTRINAERISVVDDPILGADRKVGKFTVFDGDIEPTNNPRAQLEGPANLVPGEYWAGWSTMFPADFPVLPRGGWLTFESVYGAPAEDTGPLSLQVLGDEIRFQRNATYDFDQPWRMPVVRGRWIDFASHFKLSRDRDDGFVELWVNVGDGWRQQRIAGQKRLYMQTLDASNGEGPNNFRVNNYRKRGMFEEITLYHASPKVGTSFDAVAPSSYDD